MESNKTLIENKNTIDFDEIEFNVHPMGDGIQAIVKFDNGYGASIVRHQFSYGGREGLFEMAILGQDGHITYDTSITNDVIGYLSEQEISDYLKKIKEL